MMWLDFALRGVSLASAVIATLRAGSRAIYLMEHDAIGIMDGPLILKGTNETNPMFEISEAFRHCVRLSFLPQYYEGVRKGVAIFDTMEPYTLSPQPYVAKPSRGERQVILSSARDDEIREDEEVESNIKQLMLVPYTTTTEPEDASFFQRQYSRAKEVTSSMSSTFLQSVKSSVSKAPKTASSTARRAWNWRPWKVHKKEIVEPVVEDDWDYDVSIEADLRFNSTEGISRVAELSIFCPECFADLRSVFGVSEDEYKKSIFGSGPFVSFLSNSKGAARVGGIFFFTRDGAYMIKTIKKEEAKTFLKMLPKYHRHMRRHARKSLLTRFFGMYGVRIYDEDSPDHGEIQIFTVMNAVFPAEGSKFISERFDLKGSTVGREVSEEELKSKGSNAVLKDLDLAREVEVIRSTLKTTTTITTGQQTPTFSSNDYGFTIGATTKAALLSQLREDVKLLIECQVMDYSLLVGVANIDHHTTIDESARKALAAMLEQGRKIAISKSLDDRILYAMSTPIRLLASPAIFLGKSAWSMTQKTVSSIITFPMPYYGSGKCGVDGGKYSVIHGRRRRDRAVYYLGLIDFLQPWTIRKVMERKLKGVMGYDTTAISCVTPEEYASRFLEFLDAHIS